jgi:hypothetical protein
LNLNASAGGAFGKTGNSKGHSNGIDVAFIFCFVLSGSVDLAA